MFTIADPTLTLILSSLVVGERDDGQDMLAAGLSFAGAVLVKNPTLSIDIASDIRPDTYRGYVQSSRFLACLL